MQWKRPLAACLFFLTLCGLTGCTETTGPKGPTSPKYGPVRVACPKQSDTALLIKAYGRNWEQQTGGKIELVAYDPHHDEPPVADVWVLPPAALPRWAAAGKLHTLPEAIVNSDDYLWRTVLPLYREKLVVWDRKRYALPLQGESLLCCYRSDWFADPTHQKAFESKYQRKLEPPATWDEFADIAEYFSRHTQAGKTSSLPPLPTDDDELEREFYTIAANYAARAVSVVDPIRDDRILFSFQYDVNTGAPRLSTDGFIRALQLLKRLQEFRAPRSESATEAFSEGRAVYCLVATSRLREFQNHPKVKDHFRVCRMPGAGGYYDFEQPQKWVENANNRVPYLGAGGWLAVVPKSATDQEAAFSLIKYLSNYSVSQQIVIDPRFGGGPTRHEHIETAHWDSFGLDSRRTKEVTDALRDMLESGLKNPAVRLRTPDEAAHSQVLQEKLRAALKGDKSPEKALQEAAEQWIMLDEKRGLPQHRNEFRISQGLLGKE